MRDSNGYTLFKDDKGNYSVIEYNSDDYHQKGWSLQIIGKGSKEEMEYQKRYREGCKSAFRIK